MSGHDPAGRTLPASAELTAGSLSITEISATPTPKKKSAMLFLNIIHALRSAARASAPGNTLPPSSIGWLCPKVVSGSAQSLLAPAVMLTWPGILSDLGGVLRIGLQQRRRDHPECPVTRVRHMQQLTIGTERHCCRVCTDRDGARNRIVQGVETPYGAMREIGHIQTSSVDTDVQAPR